MFHYEREIDAELWTRAQQWLQSPAWRLHIELVAEQGRGATAILEHFLKNAARDRAGLAKTRRLLVSPREKADAGPEDLWAVARALLPFDTGASARRFESLRARWRNCPTRRRILLAGVLPLVLLCFALATALDLFASSDAAKTLSPDTVAYWRLFLLDWLWRPATFATLTMVGLGTVLTATGALLFRLGLPNPAPRELGTDDLKRLNKIETLLALAERAGRGRRALVLVIDDAHALRPTEHNFVRDISSGALTRTRVLIVSRELAAARPTRPPGSEDEPDAAVRLTVPELSRGELQYIVQQRAPRLGSDALAAAYARALEDLHTLPGDDKGPKRDAIAGEFGAAFDGQVATEFGRAQLMVLWAVRGEPFVDEHALVRWIKALTPPQLALLDVERPNDAVALVKVFRESTLIRQDGRTLFFDRRSCRALEDLLGRYRHRPDNRTGPMAALLTQAHLFWAIQASSELAGAGFEPRTAADALVARRAARHWRQLMPADFDASRAGFDRDRVGALASRALLLAAAAHRLDGEFDHIHPLVTHALTSSEALPTALRTDVREAATAELWAWYLATGSGAAWQSLTDAASTDPLLQESTSWRACERYRAFVTAGPAPAQEDASADQWPAALENVRRLADALLWAREHHGFVEKALEDTAWQIPEPIETPGSNWAALALRELAAQHALLTRDADATMATLEKWSHELDRIANEDWFVPRLMREFSTARFNHSLLDAAKVFAAEPADAARTWFARSRVAGHDPADAGGLMASVRDIYSRLWTTAALLDMKPLLLDLAFQLGALLNVHAPETERRGNPDWWRRWEPLFAKCLQLEEQLGWKRYGPAVHNIRWRFFSRLDRPASIEDAYNTYVAVRDARFPTPVVLEWHDLASKALNDHGRSHDHFRCSAELHEEWASTLAALPEAVPYRKFPDSVPLERASALVFAAQARRNAEQHDAAAALLETAAGLVDADAGAQGASAPYTGARREVMLDVRLQSFWLRRDIERTRSAPHVLLPTGADALLRSLWRELEPTDTIAPLVISSLVRSEIASGRAADPWPASPVDAVRTDPDNTALSLPAAWFEDDSTPIANRFEFRLLQLLRLINQGPRSIAQAFIVVASGRWYGMNRFADTALLFAAEGGRRDLLKHHKTVVVHLLEGVRYFFHSIFADESQEMETLLQLAVLKPGSREYVQPYIDLLVQHEALLKREFEARRAQPLHWLDTATRFARYFSVLASDEVQAVHIGEALARSRVDAHSYGRAQVALADAVRQAESRRAAGDHRGAMTALEPHLHGTRYGWVTLEDVLALDLWLHCASQVGTTSSLEVRRRSAELEQSARLFIQQLGWSLVEPRVQRLVSELLAILGDAEGEATYPAFA